MSGVNFSIVANSEFSDFINRFGIGKENEAILYGSGDDTINCVKRLSTMKVSGKYTFNQDRVTSLSLKSDKQFIINDERYGIIDTKVFGKILKLNKKDYWFLIKTDETTTKIFIISENKVSEVPLSTFVDDKLKPVSFRETVFEKELSNEILSDINDDCKAIDGQFFYLGFKKQQEKESYKTYLILGEKKWYRTETDIDVELDKDKMNKLAEGCTSQAYFKENSDGYEYILRYNKDDLKSILSVISTKNVDKIEAFLNFKGGLIFKEQSILEHGSVEIDYGIRPVAV